MHSIGPEVECMRVKVKSVDVDVRSAVLDVRGVKAEVLTKGLAVLVVQCYLTDYPNL